MGKIKATIDETQQFCKHDKDFMFTADLVIRMHTNLEGAWLCKHGCGFFLNFNPKLYPNGIAYKCEPVAVKTINLKSSKLG